MKLNSKEVSFPKDKITKVKNVAVEEEVPELQQPEMFSNELKEKVIEWFKKNPNPSDDQVHAFAEEKGYNKHELEEVIYSIVTDHVEQHLEDKEPTEEEVIEATANFKKQAARSTYFADGFELVKFADIWKSLGTDVQNQVKDVISASEDNSQVDVSEVKSAYRKLKSYNAEIDEALAEFLISVELKDDKEDA